MLGRELQAEMIQRYFGLQSMQQAASLIGLQDNNQMGGLARMIKAAGIDPSKINYTNAQTLAKIGNADGMGGLDSIYADLKTREGPSALSKADTDNIDAARGKGEGAFRNALFTAANGKDYAQDQFTVARESKAVLDDIKANTGDKLFGAITTLTGDMVALMGGRKSLDAGLARDAEYTQSLIEADKQSKLAAAHQGAPDLAMAMVGIGMAPSDKIKKINDDANAAEQAAMQKARDEATGKSAGTAASSHEINVNVKAVNPATGQATTIHTQKVSLGPPRGSGTANVTAN